MWTSPNSDGKFNDLPGLELSPRHQALLTLKLLRRNSYFPGNSRPIVICYIFPGVFTYRQVAIDGPSNNFVAVTGFALLLYTFLSAYRDIQGEPILLRMKYIIPSGILLDEV